MSKEEIISILTKMDLNERERLIRKLKRRLLWIKFKITFFGVATHRLTAIFFIALAGLNLLGYLIAGTENEVVIATLLFILNATLWWNQAFEVR